MTTFEAPIIGLEGKVESDWLDYNGHANVAYYTRAFDMAMDVMFNALGLGEDYVRAGEGSCFAVEHHTRFLGEMRLGDRFSISCQLLGYDEKRVLFFATMRQVDKDYIAATSELLNLHVDMKKRRAAPFPPEVLPRLAAMMKSHAALPRPADAGRAIMQLKPR